MAQVLSPMRPPQSESVFSQSRPASSDQYSRQQQARIIQMNNHNHYQSHQSSTGYRGTSAPPVAPYAFKSTPQLATGPRHTPYQSGSSENSNVHQSRASVRNGFTSPLSEVQIPGQQFLSKDDSPLFQQSTLSAGQLLVRPYSQAHLPAAVNNGPLQDSPNKAQPARYTRNTRRSESDSSVTEGRNATNGEELPQSFGLGSLGNASHHAPLEKPTMVATGAVGVKDDLVKSREAEKSLPKRYGNRRQSSYGSVDGGNPTGITETQDGKSSSPSPMRPDNRPASSSNTSARPGSAGGLQEAVQPNTRNFASADSVRRINNPSPLSKPVAAPDSPGSPGDIKTHSISHQLKQNDAVAPSPAAAAMAALSMQDKDAQKNAKSRLRRAFSFGSSAELRRAAAGVKEPAVNRAQARREQFSHELDEEQMAIAQQQEAAGLGNSIYSGQGNFFTGSTDNLSISSTASSASIMLRKMGRGMKKGGRSIKGLFRPKSVIGVDPPDEPVQPSVGPVSMVTVEAERRQVNVNPDPHDQVGGGTGFPHLERNSLDAARAAMATNGDSSGLKDTRRSIVNGEEERQQVLAAAKRGILKRTATGSTGSPMASPAAVELTNPTFSRRDGSPSPSNASSEPRQPSHRRTDSHTLEGADYFATLPRLPGNQSSRSLPGTPRGISRNISFSPRIQFHDVWSSTEYDRRGEIATCNRLTPMLAQQIKEELNTFKMEMEVHELSKPHTHFF